MVASLNKLKFQKTIKKEISISGIGLHTGLISNITLKPAPSNHGIKFKMDEESWYIEPQNFDLLIFPGFLNHLPVTSRTQKRISLNLELKCNEADKEIFGL